jgi:hypothetical protein
MAKSDKAYFHEATHAPIVDRPQPTADNTPVLKLGRTNSSILDGRQLPSRFSLAGNQSAAAAHDPRLLAFGKIAKIDADHGDPSSLLHIVDLVWSAQLDRIA